MTSGSFRRSIVACLCLIACPLLADVTVKSGESIQKAIDAALNGATIQIEAGTFAEHLFISKPITLRGAGADKTILQPREEAIALTNEQKIQFVDRLLAQKNQEEQFRMVAE